MAKDGDNDSIDPIDIYVGGRLRLARNMHGLSQSYLGSCVDVSFQQIQKYEMGTNRISASKLAWFARLLGVPVYFFYQDMPTTYHNGGPPIAPSSNEPEILSSDLFGHETQKLVRLYYAIKDSKLRGAFIGFLQKCVEI